MRPCTVAQKQMSQIADLLYFSSRANSIPTLDSIEQTRECLIWLLERHTPREIINGLLTVPLNLSVPEYVKTISFTQIDENDYSAKKSQRTNYYNLFTIDEAERSLNLILRYNLAHNNFSINTSELHQQRSQAFVTIMVYLSSFFELVSKDQEHNLESVLDDEMVLFVFIGSLSKEEYLDLLLHGISNCGPNEVLKRFLIVLHSALGFELRKQLNSKTIKELVNLRGLEFGISPNSFSNIISKIQKEFRLKLPRGFSKKATK